MVGEIPVKRAVREAFAIVPYFFEVFRVVLLVAPVELRKWECGAENRVTLQPQDINIHIRTWFAWRKWFARRLWFTRLVAHRGSSRNHHKLKLSCRAIRLRKSGWRAFDSSACAAREWVA